MKLSEKTWAVISSVSAAVAAIAASYALYQSWQIVREDLRSKAPYIKLVAPGVKSLSENHERPFDFYRVTLDKIVNVGSRPALDFRGKLIMLDQELHEESVHETDICIANDLPPGGEVGWGSFTIGFNAEFPPYFVVLGVAYLDQGLNKTLKQMFVMKWEVLRGRVPRYFEHATCEEREKVLAKLEERLKDYLP